MEFTYFIGCDVSKSELDFAVMCGKNFLYHEEIENTPLGIKVFIKKLLKQSEFDLTKAVFCMEHTGIYNNHLLSSLHKKHANICLEAATQIKSSLGNIRGKNDKVDAKRIAEFAYKNREELRLWKPKREVIQQLASLAAIRTRLIEAHKMLKTPLKESGSFLMKSISNQHHKLCQQTLHSIHTDMERVGPGWGPHGFRKKMHFLDRVGLFF